ncbi:hypothetical protein FD29_GL000399 [Companilactobacillus mindensis DSM 14500]|jgi:hypothetical protein|uniref:Uncharacterized protein n=1 Tax=Companilactobacillus mindensis DSM 14500 TaxID=1423770 RepID=A0A0R1QL31_9LACO|nr:hypothetical protein [Companilactobacillus mindensis]KRL45478.1 hypothetical protein FD29_GL000399 [Companilactobacillus mindensis DSM 14500]GEO77816.1 hypothetical protein LMI01_01470 [Companilactobacillus mindensis]
MELGSLAEWVEGLGELLAVSVALFLPYYQQHKQTKEKNQRAKQVIIGSTNTLLSQNEVAGTASYRELAGFVSIYMVLVTNDKAGEIITLGSDIIDIINNQTHLSSEQIAQIKNKLAELDAIKP